MIFNLCIYRFGASIYVESQYGMTSVFDESAACFMRHHTQSSPNQWNDVRTTVYILFSVIYREHWHMPHIFD